VLHDQCRVRGVNSASLWAAVPSYVPAAPSPKAAQALVERVCALLAPQSRHRAVRSGRSVRDTDLDLVSEDEETAAYVAHLEEAYDHDAITEDRADELVSEVERFLREL